MRRQAGIKPLGASYCCFSILLCMSLHMLLQIKAQWRLLCKQHHPDLQPAHLRGTAERSFKEISSAYRALSARELWCQLCWLLPAA